ncbi:MAG: trigger factor [Chlamydiales bacterium]
MSATDKEIEPQSINNDNLSVIVTKKPHCQVKFEITVNPPATEAAYQKAIKKVSKEVSLPGFRKGKAPNQIIMEKYGTAVKDEFVDLVLQTGFNEALQLTHIHPLKDGTIKRPVVKECSREKGAHFIIEFESRITAPDIQLETLKVKRVVPHQITEKEQQEAIQQLLIRLANFTPVRDRPTQENDFINLEVLLFGDFPRRIDNQRIRLNKESLPNWIFEKVVGLNIGETAEGQTEPSDEFEGEVFESVPFKASVTAIWEGELPTLDDELAKKLGVDTVEALEKKMQERLEQTAKEDAFEKQSDLIENALLENYPFDIPKSYLDEEKKVRLQDYLKPLIEKKLADYIEKHRQAIESQIEQISLARLRIYFLLHALAAKNDIKPTNDEINLEFARQSALMSIGRSQLSQYKDREQLHNQLYNLAMEHKIKQYLMDKVTLVDE